MDNSARTTRSVPASRRAPRLALIVLVALCVVALVWMDNLDPALLVQPTPMPAPATPLPAPTPTPLPNLSQQSGSLLIAVQQQNGESRWVVWDLAGQRERYTIEGASTGVVSPDRVYLYVLQGPNLRAVDFHSGIERWQAVVTLNARSTRANGPVALATSPYGVWLYLHHLDVQQNGASWVQIISTASRTSLDSTLSLGDVHDCATPRFDVPPNGHSMYVTCSRDLRIIDVIQQQVSSLATPDPIASLAFAPNGRSFYALTVGADLHIIRYDLPSSSIVEDVQVALDRDALQPEWDLFAVSGNGRRLVLGASHNATDLYIYDTATWQLLTHIADPHAIRSSSLVITYDGSTVYAISGEPQSATTDTILEFDTQRGYVRAAYTRAGENIVRLTLVP